MMRRLRLRRKTKHEEGRTIVRSLTAEEYAGIAHAAVDEIRVTGVGVLTYHDGSVRIMVDGHHPKAVGHP